MRNQLLVELKSIFMKEVKTYVDYPGIVKSAFVPGYFFERFIHPQGRTDKSVLYIVNGIIGISST